MYTDTFDVAVIPIVVLLFSYRPLNRNTKIAYLLVKTGKQCLLSTISSPLVKLCHANEFPVDCTYQKCHRYIQYILKWYLINDLSHVAAELEN